jgi:pimeloyl-ACP methyl ester carboxylesterase
LPGGGELSGYVSHDTDIGASALLFVHGFASVRNGDKAQALEAMCVQRGWTFAAFEFRGHGASSGTLLDLRGDALLEDLELIRSHLASRGVTHLFPVGSSMGGWATAWFAQRHPEALPAAAFIAPAFEFIRGSWSRLSEDEQRAFRTTRRLKAFNIGRNREEAVDYALVEQADRFPPEELAQKWTTPALIFHSLQDDAVSYRVSVDLLACTPCTDIELRLFTGGDHRQPSSAATMAEEIGRFFAPHWHAASKNKSSEPPA